MRRKNLFTYILTFGVAINLFSCEEKKNSEEIDHVEKKGEMRVAKNYIPTAKPNLNHIGTLRETFNDSNKYQYAYAEKLGIAPIETIRGAYYTSRPIVMISSCEEYYVDSLTHSMPFLVPEAAALLKTIGRNFIDSLQSKRLPKNKIIVTSLLRTSSTVKKLRRVNVNATDSSTHKFGTTFDISHTRFHNSTDEPVHPALRGVLGEVLLDLRNQGRCLIKYEAKTGCFHVTACE